MIGNLSFADMLGFLTDRKVSKIDSSKPVTELSYTVLDTELTGLDPKKDSIVSIGAIRMTGQRIDLGNTLYSLVKPETELSGESVVVHGIMPSDVDEKPGIADALNDLIAFIGDTVIVGHFIALDMGFINRFLKRLQDRTIGNPVIDTGRLFTWLRTEESGFSRHFDDDQQNKDLFTIAKKYGIDISGAHNALKDAYITAQVFQRHLMYMQRHGVRTLGDLLSVGKP